MMFVITTVQEVDIDEVEEIKEMGGRTYSKMSQLFTDKVTDQHILEPSTGARGLRPLRSDLASTNLALLESSHIQASVELLRPERPGVGSHG